MPRSPQTRTGQGTTMPEVPTVSVMPCGGGALAAVCSVHGITAIYSNDVGAAFAAMGHATTCHTRPDPGATLLGDRTPSGDGNR